MISTPYACFGYVVFIVTLEDGETRDVKITDPTGLYTNGYYYYIEGMAKYKVLETEQELPDRTIGWLNYDHQDAKSDTPGTVRMTAIGSTSWVCLSTANNTNLSLPDKIESLELNKGKKKTLVQGTNLFLAKGKLQIGDKTFEGPTQIRIRTSDVSAKALENCYSLKF